MGANPLQVREQVLLLPLEVGGLRAVHVRVLKSLMFNQGQLCSAAQSCACSHTLPTFFLPAEHLWASSQATSKSELLAKNCVFVAGYTLAAVCAAISTGGSSHPTVASFANFTKKEKKSL